MKADMSAMFNVTGVDRSMKFYRQLGFDVRWEWKGDDGMLDHAGVGIGNAVIALGRIPKDRMRGQCDDYAKWVSPPLGAGVIINVELRGVGKVYAKAKKAQATIESR